MKKIYLTPDAKVIIIETVQMIADSFGKESSSPVTITADDDHVLSRDGGSWFDED